MRSSRLIVATLALGCAVGCGPKKEAQQAATANHFVESERIASVRICQTTADELVESFGAPSGRGSDGDFGTLTWSAMAIAASEERVAMGSQMIVAWVDVDGLVAGMVVNPVGIPEKPTHCSDQGTRDQEAPSVPRNEAPPSEPAHVKSNEA